MGMNAMNMPQGMFGNFGAPGMGMNGMNMNMGFNGGFGVWNDQSMDDGFNNSGFYPGGFDQQSHQGHYAQMQHQQFSRNNYQNQNRFPGRGAHSYRGYGRGYHRNLHGNHAYSHAQSHAVENGQYDAASPEDGKPYNHDRRASQGESVVLTNSAAADPPESNCQAAEGTNDEDANAADPNRQHGVDPEVGQTESNVQTIPSTADGYQGAAQGDYGMGSYGYGYGDGSYSHHPGGFGNRFNRRGNKFGFHGRNGSYGPPVPIEGQGVEGAPTGPKAMRDGSASWLRARSTHSQAPSESHRNEPSGTMNE